MKSLEAYNYPRGVQKKVSYRKVYSPYRENPPPGGTESREITPLLLSMVILILEHRTSTLMF